MKNCIQVIILMAAIILSLAEFSFAKEIDEKAAESGIEIYEPVKSSYVDVGDGLKMYYEIYGEGEPLVLLHGSWSTIELNFGKMIQNLARNRQVIGIEQQGHGHTEDIDRPFSYEQMGNDTAVLLKELGINKADILGYSDGGTVAIELAIFHPDVVRKLVVISSPYKRDGWYPEVYALIENLTPEMFVGSGAREAYTKVAPNPANWTTLIEKDNRLSLEYVGRTTEEFQSIEAQTLIIIGDSDGVRLESAVEMFKLLGGGVFGEVAGLPHSQLVVLPGTSHISIMERADWLVPMIQGFLDTPLDGQAAPDI
jgi:pimeloyl-ACP methyl ester carboxylesterase